MKIKITQRERWKIKKELKNREIKISQVACDFGVTVSAISNILAGRNYNADIIQFLKKLLPEER